MRSPMRPFMVLICSLKQPLISTKHQEGQAERDQVGRPLELEAVEDRDRGIGRIGRQEGRQVEGDAGSTGRWPPGVSNAWPWIGLLTIVFGRSSDRK